MSERRSLDSATPASPVGYGRSMQTPSLKAAALVLVAVLAAACGGGSSGAGTTEPSSAPSSDTSTTPAASTDAPADPAAAKAEIKRVWVKFFNSSTDQTIAKGLLEDGDNLGAALKLAQKEDKQTNLDRRAKVKLIKFFDATTANVTWILYNGTTPVLDNASGQAKFVDGQWKVSKLTFCTLVTLGNNQVAPKGCE
jgi:hypothetical protein